MKLIIAIVQDQDANRLLERLLDNGIGATKLASTGGFLKVGSTTPPTGVEEPGKQLSIISGKPKARKQLVTSASSCRQIY